MNKKRVAIVISTLFILIALLIFGITGIFNAVNHNSDKTKNRANINTSQVRGGTNYNHKDTDSEYDKMLAKEAKEAQDAQDERVKEAKEKKEKKAKEKKEKYNYDEIEENGKKYIADDVGGKIPKGAVGTKPIHSKRSTKDLNKNIKPIYSKYAKDSPKTTQNKITKETKILHKYIKSKNILIVNSPTDLKDDSTAFAYKINDKGNIVDTVVTVMALSGTAKQVKNKNLHYIINFNEEYIDKNTTNCYEIAKAFGMPIEKNEFVDLYNKYKDGNLNNNDYKKSYSIGYNGKEVAVGW